MKNFVNRQRNRKAFIIFSFVLLPVTFAYISCPIIIDGASKGIVTGGLMVFIIIFLSSLFLGRIWCGWLCPGGGLQEIYFEINNKQVKAGRLNLFKYLMFLAIIFVPLISAIRSAGGLQLLICFMAPIMESPSPNREHTPYSLSRSLYHESNPIKEDAATILLPSRIFFEPSIPL
jgi:polyferredoxin